MDSEHTLHLPSLAARLPDLPRWVETRSMLLAEQPEITGLVERPTLCFVLRDPETEQIFVAGTPAPAAVRGAVGRNVRGGEVIAPWEQRAWLAEVLPEWRLERVTLHELADPSQLPPSDAGDVRFLERAALRQLRIPEDLLRELETAPEGSPIAASFAGGEPVAFCYAGSITESLWDISIDTLPEQRRRGHAALAVAYMIRYMSTRGKRPVWGALVKNPASWRLAEKLGFAQVDELALFEPREESPAPEA